MNSSEKQPKQIANTRTKSTIKQNFKSLHSRQNMLISFTDNYLKEETKKISP